MADIDDIVGAARRAVDWGVNLILTPSELDVLLLEIARMKAVENRLKAITRDRLLQPGPFGRQN